MIKLSEIKNILLIVFLISLSFPVFGAPCGDKCKLRRCLGSYGSCVKSGNGYIPGSTNSDPENMKRIIKEIQDIEDKRKQKLNDIALEGFEKVIIDGEVFYKPKSIRKIESEKDKK